MKYQIPPGASGKPQYLHFSFLNLEANRGKLLLLVLRHLLLITLHIGPSKGLVVVPLLVAQSLPAACDKLRQALKANLSVGLAVGTGFFFAIQSESHQFLI